MKSTIPHSVLAAPGNAWYKLISYLDGWYAYLSNSRDVKQGDLGLGCPTFEAVFALEILLTRGVKIGDFFKKVDFN